MFCNVLFVTASVATCNQYTKGSADDRPVEFATTCKEEGKRLLVTPGAQKNLYIY
jgi:hypothetical protein